MSFAIEMSSCKLRHPFTAVVAGPTGCGKTALVLKLIRNASETIDPAPSRIQYCYGEYQPMFGDYPTVTFQEGLPQLTDEVFDGREPTLLVIDDLMSETNQLVANIFTKIPHHRNVSVLYMTQNVFDKNKYARTMSLNSHYLVLFKNPRDAGQFAILARQMYPDSGDSPSRRIVMPQADRIKTTNSVVSELTFSRGESVRVRKEEIGMHFENISH